MEQTKTIETLSPEQIEAWKRVAQLDYEGYAEQLQNLPKSTREEIEKATGVISSDTQLKEALGSLGENGSYAFNYQFQLQKPVDEELNNTSKAIESNETVSNATADLAIKSKETFEKEADGENWGTDLAKLISQGLTSNSSINSIIGASKKVAGWISDYLHFSVPEKGELSDMDKSMPDMIDLMVQGIDQNKYKLINKLQLLSEELKNSMNLSNNILGNAELKTNTYFTTPNIIFNVQEMNEENLNMAFNYINRRLGSQY